MLCMGQYSALLVLLHDCQYRCNVQYEEKGEGQCGGGDAGHGLRKP